MFLQKIWVIFKIISTNMILVSKQRCLNGQKLCTQHSQGLATLSLSHMPSVREGLHNFRPATKRNSKDKVLPVLVMPRSMS